MKTKNVSEGLKCKINPIFGTRGSQKGVGGRVCHLEKFPNNPVNIFEGVPNICRHFHLMSPNYRQKPKFENTCVLVLLWVWHSSFQYGVWIGVISLPLNLLKWCRWAVKQNVVVDSFIFNCYNSSLLMLSEMPSVQQHLTSMRKSI